MFTRLDMIHKCDRQTTHGRIGRSYALHHAAKTVTILVAVNVVYRCKPV